MGSRIAQYLHNVADFSMSEGQEFVNPPPLRASLQIGHAIGAFTYVVVVLVG